MVAAEYFDLRSNLGAALFSLGRVAELAGLKPSRTPIVKSLVEGLRDPFVFVVAGEVNTGKSTLLNKILGQKITITSNKPQTTRNRILGIHNLSDGQILFLDTPGIHKPQGKLNNFMVEQAIAACSDIDLALFLVEATSLPGGGDEYVLNILKRSAVPVVLVINKIDLPSANIPAVNKQIEDILQIPHEEAIRLTTAMLETPVNLVILQAILWSIYLA